MGWLSYDGSAGRDPAPGSTVDGIAHLLPQSSPLCRGDALSPRVWRCLLRRSGRTQQPGCMPRTLPADRPGVEPGRASSTLEPASNWPAHPALATLMGDPGLEPGIARRLPVYSRASGHPAHVTPRAPEESNPRALTLHAALRTRLPANPAEMPNARVLRVPALGFEPRSPGF